MMNDYLAAYRKALDDEWRVSRDLWKRADIGAEASARKFLIWLVDEGFAEQRQVPYQHGTGGAVQNQFRRKPA